MPVVCTVEKMKINKVFETPDGEVHFVGELSKKEVEAVVSVGINYLLQVGAVTHFGGKEEEEEEDVVN